MAAKAKRKTEDEILKEAMERVRAEQATDDTEVDEAPPKSGAKLKVTSDNAKGPKGAKGKSAQVAYHPGRDDKSWTVFFGVKFDANLPREVFNADLIALARTNPFFSVDGKRAPKHAKPIPVDEEERSLDARSGLPGGADPEKYEVEVEDVLED